MRIRTLFTVAFVVAVAASCQKEDFEQNLLQSHVQESSSIMHVTYTIDEMEQSRSLSSKQELTKLLHDLSKQAVGGHRIMISNDDVEPSIPASKDIVHFKTTDINKYDEWEAKMLSEGYEVTTEYDKETGTFYGTAVKK